MLAEFLFVYGTLKRDIAENNYALIADNTEFFAYASSPGSLYLYEDADFIYPGFVYDENASSIVQGELHVITQKEALFKILDEYEGCTESCEQPHQYQRKKITVKSNVAFEYQAWTYVYNWPVEKLKKLDDGLFR